jgi:hypothetical protein
MIWLQAGACFVLWVGYGFWYRRSSDRLRVRMHRLSRRSRTLLGSVGLLAGLAVLGAGLYLVYRFGGLTPDGLTGWGWATVAAVGLAFVHLQVLGAAAMVSLVLEEVTARAPGSSVTQENKDHD